MAITDILDFPPIYWFILLHFDSFQCLYNSYQIITLLKDTEAVVIKLYMVIIAEKFKPGTEWQLGSRQGFTVWFKDTFVKARWFLNGQLTSCYAALLPFYVPIRTVFGEDLLHASGVELASSHRYSDHTRGEGEEQSVARSVQSQRQQLPGLQRVLSTPDTHTHT